MTNENKCILAGRCKLAGGPKCNDQCASYIAMMGRSGKGGRVGAAGLPSDYKLVTLSNSPARTEQVEVYRAIDAYVKTFERQFDEGAERIKSLYFHSKEPGTGKTTSACAVLNTYLTAHYTGSLRRGKQPLQRPAFFLSVNALQQLHNKTHMPASLQTKEKLGEELLREIERAKTTPFVVLDDLAVRKATTSFLGIIYDICDYRTTEKLPTIYTSNKSPIDLREFFYEEDPEGKVVDRITDMAGVLAFSGKSKRGRR
ncbi:DNA replication protein [Peribacillus frigoritolerans]|uniref:DNA replication protein n=1 Tax=Peribacillus frigoritolerans TaxID=450367 RepID=UPI002E1D048A|nr:DNA replication protein [Peribacillus frigoritolerans]MED3845580.1 DNA replication protein [Peribacillus frigoritolerans]